MDSLDYSAAEPLDGGFQSLNEAAASQYPQLHSLEKESEDSDSSPKANRLSHYPLKYYPPHKDLLIHLLTAELVQIIQQYDCRWPKFPQLLKSVNFHCRMLSPKGVDPNTGFFIFHKHHSSHAEDPGCSRLMSYDPLLNTTQDITPSELSHINSVSDVALDGSIGITDKTGNCYIYSHQALEQVDIKKGDGLDRIESLSNRYVALIGGSRLEVRNLDRIKEKISSHGSDSVVATIFNSNKEPFLVVAPKYHKTMIVDPLAKKIQEIDVYGVHSIVQLRKNQFATASATADSSQYKDVCITIWNTETCSPINKILLPNEKGTLKLASNANGALAIASMHDIQIMTLDDNGNCLPSHRPLSIPLKSTKWLAFLPNDDQIIAYTKGPSLINAAGLGGAWPAFYVVNLDKSEDETLLPTGLAAAEAVRTKTTNPFGFIQKTTLNYAQNIGERPKLQHHPFVTGGFNTFKVFLNSMTHSPSKDAIKHVPTNKAWTESARIRSSALDDPFREHRIKS